MATVTQEFFTSQEASASVTYSDVNGSISQISWVVNSGTLVVTVHQSGKPDITVTRTTSGSQNVPNGYNLVKGPKGDWKWPGDPSFEISWHS